MDDDSELLWLSALHVYTSSYGRPSPHMIIVEAWFPSRAELEIGLDGSVGTALVSMYPEACGRHTFKQDVVIEAWYNALDSIDFQSWDSLFDNGEGCHSVKIDPANGINWAEPNDFEFNDLYWNENSDGDIVLSDTPSDFFLFDRDALRRIQDAGVSL